MKSLLIMIILLIISIMSLNKKPTVSVESISVPKNEEISELGDYDSNIISNSAYRDWTGYCYDYVNIIVKFNKPTKTKIQGIKIIVSESSIQIGDNQKDSSGEWVIPYSTYSDEISFTARKINGDFNVKVTSIKYDDIWHKQYSKIQSLDVCYLNNTMFNYYINFNKDTNKLSMYFGYSDYKNNHITNIDYRILSSDKVYVDIDKENNNINFINDSIIFEKEEISEVYHAKASILISFNYNNLKYQNIIKYEFVFEKFNSSNNRMTDVRFSNYDILVFSKRYVYDEYYGERQA